MASNDEIASVLRTLAGDADTDLAQHDLNTLADALESSDPDPDDYIVARHSCWPLDGIWVDDYDITLVDCRDGAGPSLTYMVAEKGTEAAATLKDRRNTKDLTREHWRNAERVLDAV